MRGFAEFIFAAKNLASFFAGSNISWRFICHGGRPIFQPNKFRSRPKFPNKILLTNFILTVVTENQGKENLYEIHTKENFALQNVLLINIDVKFKRRISKLQIFVTKCLFYNMINR